MPSFSQTLSPRFYETDAQGHINNATIAAWFEVARTGFLKSLYPAEDTGPQNWILANVHIDYLAETFFGDDVELRISEANAGNSSLTLGCDMWQGGRQTVRAKAVLVYIDSETKRPQRIPEALRQNLQ